MQKITACLAFLLCCAPVALTQKSAPLSREQLAEITERGRLLAEYDQAAWHATDAVMATHPKEDSDSRFICQKSDKTWTCVFGHLGADKFLIDYEAVQGTSPAQFRSSTMIRRLKTRVVILPQSKP